MGWASTDGPPRTPVTGPGSGRDRFTSLIRGFDIRKLNSVLRLLSAKKPSDITNM